MAPLQGLSRRIKTARTAFRRSNELKPSASTPLLSISQPINNGPVALPHELQAIRDQYVKADEAASADQGTITSANSKKALRAQKSATFSPESTNQKITPIKKSNTIPIFANKAGSKVRRFASTLTLNRFFNEPLISAPINGQKLQLKGEIAEKTKKFKDELARQEAADLEAFLRKGPEQLAAESPHQSLALSVDSGYNFWDGSERNSVVPTALSAPNTNLGLPVSSPRLSTGRLSSLTVVTDREAQNKIAAATREKLLARPYVLRATSSPPLAAAPELSPTSTTYSPNEELKTPSSAKPLLTYPERSKAKQQESPTTTIVYSPEQEESFKAFEQDFLKLYQTPVKLPAPPKPPLTSPITKGALTKRHSTSAADIPKTPALMKGIENSLGLAPAAGIPVDQTKLLAFLGQFPHLQARFPNSQLIPDKF